MIFFVGAPLSRQQILKDVLKKNRLKVEERANIDSLCMAHYEKRVGDEQLCEKLAKSRENVEIEVSWALALVTKQLKQVFPQCKIVGLQRNGERCVKLYKRIKLFEHNDMIFKEWDVDEFSKYCFVWNSFNDYMEVDEMLKLEETDAERLSRILEKEVKCKMNGCVEVEFPHFNVDEERAFEGICGKMMRRLGYV